MKELMAFELVCKDYGYDCDFVATGEDGEYVMREFGKHTDDEHGLWYSEESLKQLFQNKYNKK
jgi:predicted small metal-binding protein